MAAAPALALTPGFEKSYLNFSKYPVSLVSKSTYGRGSLELYRRRYEDRQSTLCVEEAQAKLPVRDISIDGKVAKANIFDNTELRRWLGDTSTPDPLNPANLLGHLATKPDPRCRFIFLATISQTAPLQLSPAMLSRLLTWHQVTPTFLEFLYVFGTPFGEDREVRYSGFRTEKVLTNPDPGNVLPQLNRSGRRYQVCYNLKAVALKDEDKKGVINKTWKVRQAAVHHQLDLGDAGGQLWMVGDPHCALKDQVQLLYPEFDDHRESFRTSERAFESSLDVHLLFCRWSTEEWRAHIQSLEEITDNLTSHVLLIGHNRGRITLEPGSVGSVQEYEDMTNDALMALESNVEIMNSLQSFYSELVADEDFPTAWRVPCKKAVRLFTSQVNELMYDTRMHAARAKVLSKIIADRKTVLIQHLQAQAATRQEQFAAAMWKQAERSGTEAVAMRIITIITLIYLPPTFSSTFFSTDVVKYQNGDGDSGAGAESRSMLALWRWLEVSLPLMALTFAAAGAWFFYERHQRGKRKRDLKRRFPDVFDNMKELP
ncbi:Fungal specific transcription factor domain-containing protein [Pleurostoma richardsiae]|uniref:Fungal specific transcription factor domain-containing protein n=1 Tax=Pleurostoma richardsiae TaxID=41990 RepID=A0AA38VMA4_9PEZI|nr:Fungal specific transcription factor domain-containing protein [Pleurostoma richardsiae]